MKPKAKYPKKFSLRFIKSSFVLVGMTSSSIYKLLNVKTFKELITADVQFNEYETYLIQIGNTNLTGTELIRPPQGRPAMGNAESSIRPVEGPALAERPLIRRPVNGTETAVMGATGKTQNIMGDTMEASDQRIPNQT